jgi:hypothetical protein
MPRYVRLKEHEPGTVRTRIPEPADFALYNGTIERKPYRLRIDADGFIASAHATELENAAKIVLLGDSVFECSFVDDGKRLSDRLNAASLATGGQYQYINAGYAAATTLNTLVTFVAKILPMRPAHIVFCADSFEMDCWSDERGYWMPHPWHSPILPCPPGFKRQPLARPNTADFAILMDGLLAMCVSAGIGLHIITKPLCPESDWSETRKKYFDYKIAALSLYNDVVREFTSSHPACWLIDLARECPVPWNEFYDANHMNAAGVQRIADALASYFHGPGVNRR